MASSSAAGASSHDGGGGKRQRLELEQPKYLTLVLNGLNGGKGHREAVSVHPKEGSLTLGQWLRQTLERKDKAPLGELSVFFDVDYEAGVDLEATLDSLGLFQKANQTVVLVVVHTNCENFGIHLDIRNPGDELRKLIAETAWGERIQGVPAEAARDRAIEAVMSEDVGEIADIEEQLRKIKGHLRDCPSKWTVELSGGTGSPGSDQVPMFLIGDEMILKLRCVDRIGLSAKVEGTTRVLVRSPPPCITRITLNCLHFLFCSPTDTTRRR